MVDELAPSLLLPLLQRPREKFLNIFAIALINVRGNYGGRELLTRQLEERQERDKTLVTEIRWELANDCR